MPGLFRIEPVGLDVRKEWISVKRVRAMILNEQRAVAKLVLRDLYKTVEFWKHTVVFAYWMHYARGNIYLEIAPVQSVRGSRIWTYVNEGTSTIPVIFSDKYVPKTTPGVLQSTPGEFTLPRERIVGKKLFPTPPGIRPRLWTDILQKYYGPYFSDAMEFAIRYGLNEI